MVRSPSAAVDDTLTVNAAAVDHDLGECAAVCEYRGWLVAELLGGRLANAGDGDTYGNAGKSEAANLTRFIGARRKDCDARRQNRPARLEEKDLRGHIVRP
jgi:hypothetical protein